MSKAIPAFVPVLAGAVIAAAVALLVGWPGQPPLTDSAAVAAAVASAVVAVLVIVVVAAAACRPGRPGRAPATRTSALPHPVEDAEPVTEPLEVVMVGPAATQARSAGSSSSGLPSAAGEPRREAGVSGRESTVLLAVDRGTDRRGFRKLIDERALVFTRLPVGAARDLAARANESVGRGDGSLHTRAEYDALFDLLADGATTVPEAALAPYRSVLLDKDTFFAEPMYVVDVEGWPQDAPTLKGPVTAPAGARLALWPTAPHDTRPTPSPDAAGVLFSTTAFALGNTGNRTLDVPKRSWRATLTVEPDGERFLGLARINLKAMYNDPSQMREALAWRAFAEAGVPASRHTYAKLTINGRYRGLFSVVEDVDRRYLSDRFGDADEGNLYKAGCGTLGCATLERRVGADGDDSGRQYRVDGDDPTYDLHAESSGATGYDDLAALIRAIDGTGLPGGDARFATDAYRAGLEKVFDTRTFLRWAGVNILLGGWDNYFATPSNYYLYNSRPDGEPWFTFLPWDYDNSFGIDYVGEPWQYADIVDWPAATERYHARNHGRRGRSRIPLVTNLLRQPELLRYYLDHLEHLLDTTFAPDTVTERIGPDGGGLWDRVQQAAYLESDTPHDVAHTGRQFSNDEVYLANGKQFELHRGQATIQAITHYGRMRHDRAREQLAVLRRIHPRGSSGAGFPVPFTPGGR